MSRILIHVGLPKTGTTTLQAQLFAKAEAVPGFRYIHFFKAPAVQSRCFSNVVGLGRDAIPDKGPDIYRNRSIKLYLERIEAVLESGAHTLIISDETLSRIDYLAANRLREIVRRFSMIADVEFVISLRPWFSWMESLINQSTKNGNFEFSTFEAETAKEIGRYSVNFARIAAFYRNGGQFAQGGSSYRLHFLDSREDLLTGFERVLGVPFFDHSEARVHNRSPTVMQSLERSFQSKTYALELLEGKSFETFLSKDQVRRLHEANLYWLSKFRALTGSEYQVDDYETFVERAGDEGAISFVQKLIAKNE